MKSRDEATSRRLLVLTSTFPRWRGDTEPAFVFALCRHLAALGHQVTALAPHAPGARQREMLDGIEVVRFRYAPERFERLAYAGGIVANLKRHPLLFALLPAFLLAQLATLARLLRGGRFDAVHAHWIVPQGLCLAMLRRWAGGARTVCTVHGSDAAALRGRFWAALRRWVARRCDAVAVVAPALRDQLLAEGCPAARIAIVPMGVDLPEGSETRRSADEILCVGRLADEKGFDVALRALPAVLAAHAEARLTIVGDGPQHDRLRHLAKTLGVAERVAFLGALPQAHLAAHYRRAAVLVVPSRREGFGLAAAEALACDCPVVASDLPALREILDNGRAGCLFPAGDVDALARTLIEMLADPGRYRDMARHGRQRVSEHYAWPAVARRYADLLIGADNDGDAHA